jgi:hypothetical protein
VFHFNGGGKAHHLSMEKQLSYMQQAYTEEEERLFYDTKLRFNGVMTPFRNICPNHLSGSRAGVGGKSVRSRRNTKMHA